MTDDQRRLTFLRDNVEHLEVEKSALESLLYMVQTSSEDVAADIFRRLRTGADINTLTLQIHAAYFTSESPSESSSTGASRSSRKYTQNAERGVKSCADIFERDLISWRSPGSVETFGSSFPL